tara:strand:- start:173 stop:784 length:612 start_codon:yes stop_codon:yes gene_type:complete
MSLILEQRHILFLHIEKNAGTSITNWLDNFASTHNDKTYLIHHRHVEWKKLPSPYNSYWTFCVVRNPWSRLVSRYNYDVSTYLQKYLAGEGDYFLKVYEKLRKGFAYWIKNDVYTLPSVEHRMKWQNQFEIFEGCNDINILKYENIQEDFKLLQNKLKWFEPLPHANATIECDYKSYYTDELIDIVAKKYSKDIEMFGYTFKG